jgi:hypothetical protein
MSKRKPNWATSESLAGGFVALYTRGEDTRGAISAIGRGRSLAGPTACDNAPRGTQLPVHLLPRPSAILAAATWTARDAVRIIFNFAAMAVRCLCLPTAPIIFSGVDFFMPMPLLVRQARRVPQQFRRSRSIRF